MSHSCRITCWKGVALIHIKTVDFAPRGKTDVGQYHNVVWTGDDLHDLLIEHIEGEVALIQGLGDAVVNSAAIYGEVLIYVSMEIFLPSYCKDLRAVAIKVIDGNQFKHEKHFIILSEQLDMNTACLDNHHHKENKGNITFVYD